MTYGPGKESNMKSLLNVETYLLGATAAVVAAATAAIRLGWRRGKRIGDR